MYNLSEAFIMPEKVLLRTHKGRVTNVGACHMGVALKEETILSTGNSQDSPDIETNKAAYKCRGFGGTSLHREVAVIG